MTSWDPELPYQNLPDLPPSEEVETPEVLRSLVRAKSALAALDQACFLLPNPGVLINAIRLLEAQSSSEIENIVTTTDELFRHASLQDELAEGSPVKEALRYSGALYTGFVSLDKRPVGINTAIEICSEIKNQPMAIRNLPGTKIANPDTGRIIYTPPEHADVLRKKLANWEQFLHNNTTLDPLIRMAIAHYQFEAIHPFFDGNGRTDRVINILALVQFELLRFPVLYLSRFILENKTKYYDLLNAVTAKKHWHEWTIFMLEAVEHTADWTIRRIHEICALQDQITNQIKTQRPAVYRRELVEIIFEQPYCRIDNIVSANLATRQTASNWLHALAEIGILKMITVGRTKLFINHQLYRLLTQY